MAKIAVVGSCSVDLVVEAQARPQAGETLFGKRFFTTCGGKGANQAVAASRLGADTYIVGAVGDDAYGKMLIENFVQNQVHTDYLQVLPEVTTGTAHITLAAGDNSILVVPGANFALTKAHIDQAMGCLRQMDIVLLQHEVPNEINRYVVAQLADTDVEVLLNPAPAESVPTEILTGCRYLTPNEHEYEVLFGETSLSEDLREKVIVTRGNAGATYYQDGIEQRIPAYQVEAVDTTGAGDTFNAAFAVARADGLAMDVALRFANAAAALSVMGLGAQGGMPTRRQVEEWIQCNE